MDFETDDLFDIIILGDVLEHIPNPSKMLEKAYNLLDKEGVIWISTPNFESAFSYIMKDKDPMWRVCEHLNYFSYISLKKTLEKTGFKTVDYKISQHYNGCMEITAIKTEN
jgi:2-polyprenyl-3-methyl-5-hydroxy-6-metoxy-1,4-benzoquinol methylase